jgi:hypothetical protein
MSVSRDWVVHNIKSRSQQAVVPACRRPKEEQKVCSSKAWHGADGAFDILLLRCHRDTKINNTVDLKTQLDGSMLLREGRKMQVFQSGNKRLRTREPTQELETVTSTKV